MAKWAVVAHNHDRVGAAHWVSYLWETTATLLARNEASVRRLADALRGRGLLSAAAVAENNVLELVLAQIQGTSGEQHVEVALHVRFRPPCAAVGESAHQFTNFGTWQWREYVLSDQAPEGAATRRLTTACHDDR